MKLKIKVEDLFGTDTYEVDGVLKDADDSPRKITVINMGEHHKDMDDEYVPFMDKCGERYTPNM